MRRMCCLTDEMLSDASWLLMQVDVATVNIPAEGRCEHRGKNERGGGGKVLQVWSRHGFFSNMKCRQHLLAKNLDRSSRKVSRTFYRGVTSSCAGELDTGCCSFISFLASVFHHGAEIAIAQSWSGFSSSRDLQPWGALNHGCARVELLHRLGWQVVE